MTYPSFQALKKLQATLLLFFCIGFINHSIAQIPQQYLEISVSPDHPDWTYKLGEKV